MFIVEERDACVREYLPPETAMCFSPWVRASDTREPVADILWTHVMLSYFDIKMYFGALQNLLRGAPIILLKATSHTPKIHEDIGIWKK